MRTVIDIDESGGGSRQSTPNDLVLGVVYRYSWSDIEPFIVSLRATGYIGHICLIYHDLPSDAYTRLLDAGVELMPFHVATVPAPDRRRTVRNVLYRLNRSPLGQRGLLPRLSRSGVETIARFTRDPYYIKAKIIAPVLSINLAKAPLSYHFLAQNPTRFSRVMLTDVRDVLFQRNPFDFEFGDELCVFLEQDGVTIGTCSHTGPLVHAKYGSDMLQYLATRPAICAGITIGSTEAVLRYLRAMIDESTGLLDQFNQGIHNVLLYRGTFDPVRVFPNDAGPVLTMGRMHPSDVLFDREGYVARADGSVINVLHQYDRHLGRNGLQLGRVAGTVRLTHASPSGT